MPVVTIDADLKPPQHESRYKRTAQHIYDRTIPPGAKGQYHWQTKTRDPDRETFISASFGDEQMEIGHINYTEYLCQAYADHRSIVLTPDIVWHTVLSEVAAQVVANPKLYETLFTTTPGEKQEIVLPVSDVESFPMGMLMEELKARVPTDVVNFLPDFTTTDEMARFVRWTNFAEVCSPYYSYMTLACGYPHVDVRGDRSDYNLIIGKSILLASEFEKVGDTVLTNYLRNKVRPLMADLMAAVDDEDAEFFKNILTTRRCGSGGEIEVDGWWPKRMYVKDFSSTKPENLPTHVARMIYKNLDTGREFSINAGLLYSSREGEFTVPQWGWVKNEILAPARKVKTDRYGHEYYEDE